jgi:hypothetical protein
MIEREIESERGRAGGGVRESEAGRKSCFWVFSEMRLYRCYANKRNSRSTISFVATIFLAI